MQMLRVNYITCCHGPHSLTFDANADIVLIRLKPFVIFSTDYNSSRRRLVRDVWTGEEPRHEAVQHLGSGEVPVHGGGGDVGAAEGPDRAPLRRGDRRLGQSTRRHSRWLFYTIDTKVVSLVSCL